MGVGVSGTIRYDDMYEVPSSVLSRDRGQVDEERRMPSPRPQRRDGISSWAETELRQALRTSGNWRPVGPTRRRKAGVSEDEDEGVLGRRKPEIDGEAQVWVGELGLR